MPSEVDYRDGMEPPEEGQPRRRRQPIDRDDGTPVRSRPRRSALPRLVVGVAVVIATVVLLIAAGVFWSALSRQPGGDVPPGAGVFGPSEGNEGEKWNHPELVAHLATRGVRVEQRPTQRGVLVGWGTTVELWLGDEMVYCQLRSTAKDARDYAGSLTAAFAWGRFCFRWNEAESRDSSGLAGAIKRALGGK